MKRSRRIALWSAVVLITVLAGAATWLWTADLGLFRPHIERLVSEWTGRNLEIGELSIDLGGLTVITAENIRFANAEWASEPHMVSVDRLEVRADLWSLFNGPMVVHLIDADGIRVFLARAEDGRQSWNFGGKTAPRETQPEDERGFDTLFSEITVDDARVIFESPERTGPIDLRIDSLRQQRRPDDMLELAVAGSLGDRSINVSGELGTWNALVAGENIEYSLSGSLDRFSLNSSGFIDNLVAPHRPSLTFSAAGPDINDLFELARIDATGEGDIRIDGSLAATGTEPLLLTLKGNVGRLKIDASGSFSDLQDFENIDLEVAASGPDLAKVLKLFDIHNVGAAPFVIDLDAERRGSRMTIERARMEFADAVFSAAAEIPRFPDLHDADIELSIVGPDVAHFREMLNLPGTATGAFSLLAELETRDDGIDIAFLRAETSLGRLEAEGFLGEEPRLVGTEVRFTLQSPSLAGLAGSYGLPRLPDAPVEISGTATLEADGVRMHGPLVAKIDDITITTDGLMRGVRGLYGSQINYSIEGPDLAQLVGAFADSSWVPAERYALRGVLDIGEDGFGFRNVAGTLGDSNVSANGLLRPVSGIAGSKFTFAANGPEIGVLIPGAVDLEIRPGPYELSGALGFGTDSIRLENIRLERELGKATVNLEIGNAERWLKFAMNADGRDIRSVLSRIEGIEPNEAPFSLNAVGEFFGKRLAFESLDVVVGEASLTARGDLDLTESAQSTRFQFEVDIASLARLGTFWGYQMRPQALHVNAAVVGEGGVLSLTDATARLDDSDIYGAIHYETGDIPELRVDIASDSLLLASPLEQREAPIDQPPTFDDGRVIPDTAVPLEALASLNAAINIKVGDLIRIDKHYRNVELSIEMRNGALELSKLGFDAPSGRLDARATLTPSAETAVVQLEIAATDLAFGIAESNRDLSMTGELQVNLNSAGSTLRELAANTDGVVLIDTRGGRGTSSPALQRLFGNMLGEILAVINPFYKDDPYAAFRCIIVPLQVDKGRLVSAPSALILTDKVQIVTTGQIDFATEALELTFRTTPRKGVVISAGEILNPFVKIVGTLAEPRLAVDEQGVLISGGAAVATAGLSILAKAAWDRLNRSSDPCGDSSKLAREALSSRFANLSDATIR